MSPGAAWGVCGTSVKAFFGKSGKCRAQRPEQQGRPKKSPRPRRSRAAAEPGRAGWAAAAAAVGGGEGIDPALLHCSLRAGAVRGTAYNVWGGDWGEESRGESLGRGKGCFPCVPIYLSQYQNQ